MRSICRYEFMVIVLVSSALLGCNGSGAQEIPESLAPNASLEEGEGQQPAAWSFYSWEASEGWWDDEFAHSGSRSLGLRGLNGGWSANMPVEAGKICNLKLYYRAENGPSRIVIYVQVPKGGREMETIVYKPVPTVPHDQSGQFVDGVYVGGVDERGWALAEGGDFIPPAGATSVRFLLKLVSKNAEARAWLDDVIVTAAEPREVPDTARLLREVPGGKVWTESENRKIFPDREPPGGEPQEGIEIAGAQGEYESFQIAVRPEGEWRGVNWTWEEFSGPAALAKSELRCRRVETINIEKTQGPYGHKGLNPDPLTEQLPCDVPAGTNQAFWFTVRVPQGQTPGQYENELTLMAGGQIVCQVPLRLKVRSFAIPRRPTIDARSSFRASLMTPRESGDQAEVLARYYRDFYEHRSRCAPAVRPSVRVEGKSATVDAGEYVSHLRFMRDELGMQRLNMPSLWISHRGTHKMPPDAQWQGRPIFANAELTRLNPDFEAPFRDYMEQLIAALKDEGLLLEPSVRFIDEPNLADGPTINGIRALSELLLDIEPELAVCQTATYPEPSLTDLSKLWVLHTDAWDRNIQHIEAAREAGCKIYVYNNAVNYPEHNPLRVRLWPWLLRKYGVDGTYSWWGTVCWRGDFEDPWNAGRGNSGVLMYPPRSADEHGPIDSVRWELFREGLEDYEYLRLADTLAQQLEEAGKAEAARQGREAVAAALALVERWPNVRAANDEPYTLDVMAVAAARETLAAAIEAMQ